QRPDGVTTRWQHDALGRVVQFRDEPGRIEVRKLDALGRPTLIHTSDGAWCELEYDGVGNVVRVRDEERERVLSYFGTGKLSSRSEGGYTLQLEYDTEERLTALVNEAGDLYEFETDAAGRVTAEVEFDGSRTRYERDDAGRVTTLTR